MPGKGDAGGEREVGVSRWVGEHPLRGKGEGAWGKELWDRGLGRGQHLECKQIK